MAKRNQSQHGNYRDMRRVLLLMHTWAGYVQGVQMGIADYILHRPEWIWTRLLPLPDSLEVMRRTQFDGVIAYLEPAYQAELQRLKIPVVDISNWLSDTPFPRVLPDDEQIGRLAAQYLTDLGLRHFGVVGPARGAAFSALRCASFCVALSQQGFFADAPDPARHVLPPHVQTPAGVSPLLASWLLQMPKPAGILATFDGAAAEVLEVCRHLGIRVPEDVCVLGVDNDELISRFTHPPLSSIALPGQKIGFEAARLLDGLMAGEKPPQKPICLAPLGVVARQSTNLLAIPDEDVQAAVRYIRSEVHRGVTVRDVLRHVPVNRRYLERKFKQHVGRTPLQEIRRARIERVKKLLAETDLSMPAIARRGGFPNAARFSSIFHQETGTTPTAYRRAFRLAAEGAA